MHRHLHTGELHRYRPVAMREVHAFLRRTLDMSGGVNIRSINRYARCPVMDTPSESPILSRIFAGTMLDVVYGIQVTSVDDPNIVRTEKGGECFGKMKVPGAFWADSIPILQYIPAWAPGGSAQRFAAQHRPTALAMRDEPFGRVRTELVGQPLISTCSVELTPYFDRKQAHISTA